MPVRVRVGQSCSTLPDALFKEVLQGRAANNISCTFSNPSDVTGGPSTILGRISLRASITILPGCHVRQLIEYR
jgi:hypothetical protein